MDLDYIPSLPNPILLPFYLFVTEPCKIYQSTLFWLFERQKLTEEMHKELSRLEAERKRRQKEKKLKSQVVEKAAANDIQYGLVDQTKEKLRQYRCALR